MDERELYLTAHYQLQHGLAAAVDAAHDYQQARNALTRARSAADKQRQVQALAYDLADQLPAGLLLPAKADKQVADADAEVSKCETVLQTRAGTLIDRAGGAADVLIDALEEAGWSATKVKLVEALDEARLTAL